MNRIRRILAATDLSAPARHACARACRIAGETGAALTLIHVLCQGAMEQLRRLLGASSATVEQHLQDEARERLIRLAAKLNPPQGCTAGIIVATGRVLNTILDQADAQDADLIVLGARGEGYLSRLLLGTTAERLLRRSTRPMLVVKQTAHAAYRRVLVPLDFSAWSIQVLRLAQAVAPSAELVLFNAYEAPFESKLRFAGVEEETLGCYLNAARQEALDRLKALAAEAGLATADLRYDIQHGDPSRLILVQEQELDCDLIVMGKHGQGMLEELLLGSVTKHVLAESIGDVLVVGLPADAA